MVSKASSYPVRGCFHRKLKGNPRPILGAVPKGEKGKGKRKGKGRDSQEVFCKQAAGLEVSLLRTRLAILRFQTCPSVASPSAVEDYADQLHKDHRESKGRDFPQILPAQECIHSEEKPHHLELELF